MLKAKIHQVDGSTLLLIGLSSENMKRLLEDKPILFSGSEVGFPAVSWVLLIGGKTNGDLMEQLKKMGMETPMIFVDDSKGETDR